MNCSKNILPSLALLCLLVSPVGSKSQIDSLQGFDLEGASKHAGFSSNMQSQMRLLEASKRNFILRKYFSNASEQTAESLEQSQKSAGNCDNVGFENGTINGWTVKGDYSIVASGVDAFGKFPKVYPDGKYSLQLNNNKTLGKSNFEASATRLINVSSSSSVFNLRFAFVILNYPHDSASAARFRISLRDSTKHTTICADYNIYYEYLRGPIGTSNFTTSSTKGINTMDESYDVTYAPWQTVSIDLSEYVGRTIAIKINCDWCVYKVDWAYCYIDGDCNAVVPQTLPCMTLPGIISGPPGLSYYKWLTPQGNVVVRNTNTLAVNSTGIYELHCNQNSICNEAPFLYKYEIPAVLMPVVSTSTLPCSLAASYAIYTPLSTDSYTWLWPDGAPTPGRFSVTHNFKMPGLCTATLQVKNSKGCIANLELKNVLSAPVSVSASTTEAPDALYGPDDFKTYEGTSDYIFGNLNYKWEGDNFLVHDKYARLTTNGVYTVEAVDPLTGCKDTATVNVELQGWVPNVFTPNNDGVNDAFRFRYQRHVMLSITNRWGHIVHEAADEGGILSWDGTTGSNDCSDGVYFYTITPTESNQKSISGSVTLLR